MHRLTTAHYYRASGLDMHQRETRRRLEGIAAVLHEYGESQVATAKKDSFLNGRVAAYATNSDALWAALGKRSWAKRRLHLYGAKKRVLDKFVQSLVPTRRDPRPVIVGYGAANYASGGRGGARHRSRESEPALLPEVAHHLRRRDELDEDVRGLRLTNVEDIGKASAKDASWCRRRRPPTAPPTAPSRKLRGDLRGPRRALLSRVREKRTRNQAARHERGEEHRDVPPQVRAARERRNPSGRFPPRREHPVPGNFSVATSPRRSGRREGFPPPPKRTPCKALKSSHARPFLVPMTQAAARRADRQIGPACLVPLPDCLASKEARRGFISYRVAGRTFERDAAGTRVGWRSNGGGPYIQRKVFR